MQLLRYRCMAVLRHRLEAAERDKLGLRVQHTLNRLGSQCADQLVLKISYTREEAERFKGLVGRDRNGRVGKRAADMPLVSDVVHAAELGIGLCAHKVSQHPREVGDAIGRPDVDVVQAQIATDEGGHRPNSGGIAIALDKHQSWDRGRG